MKLARLIKRFRVDKPEKFRLADFDPADTGGLDIEKDENVHFERAWADPASGTVYCLSEAPSADAVQRIHERAGHKADEIHPVPLMI